MNFKLFDGDILHAAAGKEGKSAAGKIRGSGKGRFPVETDLQRGGIADAVLTKHAKNDIFYYGNKSCHKSGYQSFTKFGTLPKIKRCTVVFFKSGAIFSCQHVF
ncbi:MAG: hypothetical protein IKC89_03770 [Lentisphaeria bacterium]|nr:hypothetical protein [Lentisphaeria bacterium]